MPFLLPKTNIDSNVSTTPSHDHQLPVKPAQANIKLIPAQIDGLCGTCPSHTKQNPIQIFKAEIMVYSQNLKYGVSLVRSLLPNGQWQQSSKSWRDVYETFLQIFLALSQICMLFMAVLISIFLPASVFALYAFSAWLLIKTLTLPLNGARIVMSDRSIIPVSEEYTDECWIFINGPLSTSRSMYSQCNRLSVTFNRPIVGIHAPTHGLLLDIFTAALFRIFQIQTPTTRALTLQIRDSTLNNSIRKVILVGHSTGALHISLALDTLHADLPHSSLSKLEIYTFGSFATHLSNPCLKVETLQDAFSPSLATQANLTRPDGSLFSPVKATLASLGHRVEDRERVIPHVEHYAFASDFFARCGVLHHTKNVLDNRYCGRVFEIDSKLPSTGRSASYIFTDYLDVLFPPLSTTLSQDRESSNLDLYTPQRLPVLDTVISVDIATAEKREFTAQGVALPLKSTAPIPMQLSHLHHHVHGMANGNSESPNTSPRSRLSSRAGSPQINAFSGFTSSLTNGHHAQATSFQPTSRSEKRTSWGTAGTMGIDGVGKARSSAKELVGRTVRQVSRLWRYEDGGRPIGEGVPALNGVGVHDTEVNGAGGMTFTGEGIGIVM